MWKMIIMAKSFMDKCKKDKINAYAAQSAFFILLSLIPFLMVFSSLLRYTPITEETLIKIYHAALPEYLSGFLGYITNEVYNRSVGIVSITAVVAIWSAAKGIQYLTDGLNSVNDLEENRNWFTMRLWAVVYTVGFLVAFVFVLGVLVFGNTLHNLAVGYIPVIKDFAEVLAHFRGLVLLGILFVFFVAGMLYKNTDFKTVCITTIVAAVHVLILVASRDLGGALIFFVTYLVMLYVATRKLFYFAGGLLVGCIAAVAAYGLFSHVRVRVVAWRDPLSVIDNEGYQICQSLFAIGTGGWFGTGLYQGAPNKIPVVEQDFIFSAISEELGGIFAICLIMVCISCFLMFLNIAMQMKEQFYKLVALGLGTVYAFQVFLTIGGVTKFIPSTGVTLPLVSYGGSSLLATMMLFAVIQGLYILRQDEGENNARKKQRKTGYERQQVEELY